MRDVFAPWTGRALRAGIAADAVALLRTSVWPHERTRLLGAVRFDPAGGPAAMAGALAGLMAEHRARGWPLTLVLADELVRLWQVAPPANAARLADLQAAAALRFQALFGASAAGWRIQADWHATQPFLAAATPQALLDALGTAARTQHAPVVEIVPQLVATLNRLGRSRSARTWFALVHGGVLSLVVFDGKRLAALRTAAMPADADRAWLEALVAREALRAGLDCPERMHLHGAVPQGWAGSAGRMKLRCTVSGDDVDPLWPDVARLALSGSRP